MCLRNQAFQTRANTEKERKLEIVLRQLTADHLTAQQRQLIRQAIGCREQYSIQLCQDIGPLSDAAVTGDGQPIIRWIFGNAEANASDPAAVLIRTPIQGGMSNTVYIYLPMPREEKKDDTRQKEPFAQ